MTIEEAPRTVADPQLCKIPLVLEPQPEGGFTVTSPALPELVTEGESVEEALANVQDALRAVIEVYQEAGRPLPVEILTDPAAPIRLEHLVAMA